MTNKIYSVFFSGYLWPHHIISYTMKNLLYCVSQSVSPPVREHREFLVSSEPLGLELVAERLNIEACDPEIPQGFGTVVP
jgi:hypothetical protein